MTTARDLCLGSFIDAGISGVGQTMSAEDINVSFVRLNGMIGQWNRKRWMVYHLDDVSFVGTGAEYYTVGTGGNFNIPRPDTIESAYFRLLTNDAPNQVDYPLEAIRAREDYNLITMKQLATFPQVFFYDSGYPTGKLYVWPLPNDQYEIHISTKVPLQTFTSLNDDFELPPEYEEAMRLNLAVRLRIAFQLQADPALNTLAKVAMNTIKNANAQIPSLQMPQDLMRPRLYNIYGDNQY